MISLIFFMVCLTFVGTIYTIMRLSQIERDMIEAKLQHEITQQVPVRRRRYENR